MKRLCCLFTGICLLTSCSSIHYINIETYSPAEITYPSAVRKVLIVNNALPQPPEIGCEYKLMGTLQDTCKACADSALFDACRALGTAIAETGYFDDVLFFHEGTRKDDVYYSDVALTPEQVASLCEETGTDAVISFDRLLFNMKKNVSLTEYQTLFGTIDVYIKSIARSYRQGDVSPVTLIADDSIFFQGDFYNLDELVWKLPSPDDALRMAGTYLGEKLYTAFVPHWKNETRWFYTGAGARWKEATAFAADGKWAQAADRWLYIYNRENGWADKARAASNLALAYEMRSDMQKAVEWATVSLRLYNKNKGAKDANTSMQKTYLQALEQRLADDKTLTIQIGEAE
ncbi:MAG: tetratricopeptide repeat protein [Bacteroidales bacterium]